MQFLSRFDHQIHFFILVELKFIVKVRLKGRKNNSKWIIVRVIFNLFIVTTKNYY